MKRVLILIIMAFLISGGTIGILYQEGIGGLSHNGGSSLFVEETVEDAEE